MSTLAKSARALHKVEQEQRNPWAREVDDLVRGASGGFLFGVPLLYTMEVWWIGSYTEPARMLVALATTYVAVFLLTRTAGFRRTNNIRLRDAAMDSVEALAIGVLCATATLFLLGELQRETPLDEALGKIVFEAVPFALGVALASQVLTRSNSGQPNGNGQPNAAQQPSDPRLNATLADVGATVIGATIVAFNVAPTDEIPMLAAGISPPWLILLIGSSLLISYGIVFEADFADQRSREQQQGLFQRPISETVMSYLVSLAAAAFMLWFFQRVGADDPWTTWLSYSIVLGLPATIGGAAGRLAV